MPRPLVVRIGEHCSEVERCAARLLAGGISKRTGAEVREGLGGDVTIGTPESSKEIRRAVASGVIQGLDAVGAEGFLIAPSREGCLVAANRPAALVFAAGRLIRETVAADGPWRPPRSEIRSAPALPIRSVYFASHMGNWYSHAPWQEVYQYVDEMALWGYNELTTILEVRPGETFRDAWARLSALEAHARNLGMRVARIAQSNTSFDKPPDEFRATPGPIPGVFDVCPSKPGAREFVIEDKRRFFEMMRPFDVMCLWPYDGGGCYCEQCAPWARTYLDLSREIADRAVGSAGEVRISAWFFGRDVPGEDDVLYGYLAQRPGWFRHVVAGAAEASRWKKEGRVLPEAYRVLLFPDVSMFDGVPWGGRGANPAPRKFAQELRDVRDMLAGGIVYSEGRYDDVNKILWAQMLWDPDRDPADIVREYCRFYLDADVEREAASLLLDVEQGMNGLPDPERWRRGHFYPQWDGIASAIEEKLSPEVRDSWRWQFIRAKSRIEVLCRSLHDADLGPAERDDTLANLRETYAHLQRRLNRHDPERSLQPWIYAPVEEAFQAGIIGELPTPERA